MSKKSQKKLVIGAALGAAAAVALSSKKVRGKIKQTVKREDKSKLKAIKDILEDKAGRGADKAATIKEKLAQKKNDISK